MRRFSPILALAVFGIAAAFSAPPASATLPPLLQAVENRYSRAATFTADFTQINESAALRTHKKSTGELMFKRPNKIYWETKTPDKSLLVSDGKTFWFYTPPFDESEHGQVIERKTTQVESKLAHALLAGSFSASAHDMKITQISPSEFTLRPKKGAAGTVSKATIEIDPDQKLIKRVTLDHRDGNHTEIALEHIELGRPLEDSHFLFQAPPGTDHVKN